MADRCRGCRVDVACELAFVYPCDLVREKRGVPLVVVDAGGTNQDRGKTAALSANLFFSADLRFTVRQRLRVKRRALVDLASWLRRRMDQHRASENELLS